MAGTRRITRSLIGRHGTDTEERVLALPTKGLRSASQRLLQSKVSSTSRARSTYNSSAHHLPFGGPVSCPSTTEQSIFCLPAGRFGPKVLRTGGRPPWCSWWIDRPSNHMGCRCAGLTLAWPVRCSRAWRWRWRWSGVDGWFGWAGLGWRDAWHDFCHYKISLINKVVV